jgi:mycofactocin precursor peptide peptidase
VTAIGTARRVACKAGGPVRWRAAGRTETSLQLALAPERVRRHLAQAGDTRPIAELLPILQSSSVSAVSPSGVLGDPAGASAAEGAALLDQLLADLLGAVAAWQAPAT